MISANNIPVQAPVFSISLARIIYANLYPNIVLVESVEILESNVQHNNYIFSLKCIFKISKQTDFCVTDGHPESKSLQYFLKINFKISN